jgi:hypothetical protein
MSQLLLGRAWGGSREKKLAHWGCLSLKENCAHFGGGGTVKMDLKKMV